VSFERNAARIVRVSVVLKSILAATEPCALMLVVGCSDFTEEIQHVDSEIAVRLLHQEMENIQLGYDVKNRRVVEEGAEAFVLKSAYSLSESTRQRSFHAAFGKALINIATDVLTLCERGEEADLLKKLISRFGTASKVSIPGVRVVAMKEAFDPQSNVYQVAVALEWSPSIQEVDTTGQAGHGKFHKQIGEMTIDERLNKINYSKMLGGEVYVDCNGEIWLIGTVSDDGSSREWYRRWVRRSSEASYYYGISRRAIREDVSREIFALYSATRMVINVIDFSLEPTPPPTEGLDMSGDRRISAPFHINVDNNNIKWVEKFSRNEISGREIKVLVAAVRIRDVKDVEKFVRE